MKIFEIAGSQFDPLLIEFWRQRSPQDLQHYTVSDNCIDASNDLLEFLEQRGIGNAEVVPIGTMKNGKKKQGWIQVDQPVYEMDTLTDSEIAAMQKQGLDPRDPAAIKKFAEQNNLVEEFTWIPHSWVELRGQILDPSGFYPTGNGQFDQLVGNKVNLASRYRFFG